jgi:hypothetical protein
MHASHGPMHYSTGKESEPQFTYYVQCTYAFIRRLTTVLTAPPTDCKLMHRYHLPPLGDLRPAAASLHLLFPAAKNDLSTVVRIHARAGAATQCEQPVQS